MCNNDWRDQRENEKLIEQIQKLKNVILRMEEDNKEELNKAIRVFEEEKVRVLSSLVKSQKSIFVKSIKLPNTIVELKIHEISDKYIKCFEDGELRKFSVESIGRSIAFTKEDFERNKSDVVNLKKSTSEYKKLSATPTVDQKYWPPKILGGVHHD